MVGEAFPRKGSKGRYIYDMGDEWVHELVREDAGMPEPGVYYPRCLDGAGACPPEDCGGIYGYMDMLESLKNPDSENYYDTIEWIGDDFDPAAFDLAKINATLESFEGSVAGDDRGEDEFDGLAEVVNRPNYAEPVRQLLELGPPEEDFDYSSLGISAKHVQDLIVLATDMGLYLDEEDDEENYGPEHAWLALGQLQAHAAILPLLQLFSLSGRGDSETLHVYMPGVFAQFGAAAVPELAGWLHYASDDDFSRLFAATCLSRIAKEHPHLRDECAGILMNQLKCFQNEEGDFNGLLIYELVEARIVEAAPIIRQAFEAGSVDLSILGDWDDVRALLDLME
jgi:hypothetical protein